MGRQSSIRRRELGSGQVPSRRSIFKGGVAVAAVGVSAGVLATATARPASADTVVESRAVAPTVVNLAGAPTIAVDASLGNDFRLTIGGNRTMGNPANPSDGQEIVFQVTQGSGGSFTMSWASGYEFAADLPQPTLSSSVGQTDVLWFEYNAARDAWLLTAFVNGFD